jgi:hypothetical protein
MAAPGRRARKFLAGSGLLVVTATAVVVGTAIPAAAHDALLSTDPEAGADLDAPPDSMTLTYSSDVAEEFAAAVVTAPGADPVPLPPASIAVSGAELRLDLTALAAGAAGGEWSIVVRIVSVDGHPVEERIAFDAGPGVADAPTAGPPADLPGSATSSAPGADSAESSAPEVSPMAAESRVDDAAAVDGERAAWVTPVAIAVAAAVAVALAAALALVVRRR